MKKAVSERTLSILSPVALLVIWEVLVRFEVLDRRFFPPPSVVLRALWEMAASGSLADDLRATFFRILIGFVVAAVPGVLLGLVMGLSPLARAVLSPIIAALYPIPKSAILPLLLLIFGLGEASKVAMVASGVFFLVLLNTMAGVLNIEPVYFDVSRTFGASRWQVIRSIALPGALPLVMTGLQLGFGMGLIVVVIAEFVGAKNGIGYMIWYSWQVFMVDRMFAGLIVISMAGYVTSLLFSELERRIVPWKQR